MLKILLLGCIVLEVTNNNNGKIVNEQTNEMINEIIIMIPKSIIGLISVKIKDPNATIVVNDVYRQGQNIFLNVLDNLFILFELW